MLCLADHPPWYRPRAFLFSLARKAAWFLSQFDDAVIWLLRMPPLCIPRARRPGGLGRGGTGRGGLGGRGGTGRTGRPTGKSKSNYHHREFVGTDTKQI